MAKRKVNPDKKRCVACGVCIKECPFGVMSVYKGCYAVADIEECVGYGRCEKACPANAIFMKEETKHEYNVTGRAKTEVWDDK